MFQLRQSIYLIMCTRSLSQIIHPILSYVGLKQLFVRSLIQNQQNQILSEQE
ncbi:hypothetical protein pb186bvf_000825 [Paramecium bursaria]